MEMLEKVSEELMAKWQSLPEGEEKEQVSTRLQSMGFVLCEGGWVHPGTNEC